MYCYGFKAGGKGRGQTHRGVDAHARLFCCSSTPRSEFVTYADQLLRSICEFSLNCVPTVDESVSTPTGAEYAGCRFARPICGVAILRAGEAMEVAFRAVVRNAKIGKILIQRDESTPDKSAKLFYSKLPSDIAEHHVMLLDPMIATGGSALSAVQVLLDAGVPEEQITAVHAIAARDGVERLLAAYPKISVVLGELDPALNEDKFIVPGVGDFGDRYFGTT